MVPFKQTTPNPRRAVSIRSMATLLAASAGAALLAAAPLRVTAAPPAVTTATATGDGGVSAAVRYGDLNVNSEPGARILLARIQFAAGEVCPYADDRNPERVALRNQCVEQAIARAVQQVGSARLAAVYSTSGNHG